MIILARYCRLSRISRKRKNKSRTSLLFDKVYGIWRDHCRIEWTRWKLQRWRWYLIRWDPQNYIDKEWNHKISILPSGKLWVYPSEHTMQRLRMYKNRIRKKYNIYIKTPFYFYKARVRRWYLKMLTILSILSW